MAALPVTLLTNVVISRFLLPTGRGAFTLAVLTVTLGASILRTGAAVTHMVSQSPRAAPHDTLVRALVTSCTAGMLGAGLLIPLNAVLVPHAPTIAVLAPLVLPAMLVTDAFSGLLLAKGRVAVANRVQFLSPAVALAVMAILVLAAGLGLRGAVIAWMISQCVATLAAAVVCLEYLRNPAPGAGQRRLWDQRAWQITWFAARSGMVGAVSVINYRIDLFLLRAFHGVHDVGIYSLAVSLAELGWILPQSLTTASTPAIVNAENDRDAASLTATASRFALILSTVTALAITGAALLLLPDIFGHPFAPSTDPLIVLLPGIIMFAPASELAVFISLRKGRVGLTGAMALVSALATVIAGVAVIPALSSIGAAIASAAGYAVGALIAVVVFARMTGVPLREFVPRWDDYRYVRAMIAPSVAL